MKIALVQMRSTDDLERNLRHMEKTVASCAKKGARLVAFPEMAYFCAPLKKCASVTNRFDTLTETFRGWAEKYSIALMPGSVREPGPNGKHFNTSMVFAPSGDLLAKYRKIFLFRAKLPDRTYDESQYTECGCDAVTFEYGGVRMGLAICFDLRFPELFRALKKKGAQLVLLPSAFTVPTGRAHWETLIRARAIENQIYVAAPGLVGRGGNGAATFGNSLAVDPWGRIRARAAGKPSTVLFTYDSRHALDCTGMMDPWSSRREDLFPIP